VGVVGFEVAHGFQQGLQLCRVKFIFWNALRIKNAILEMENVESYLLYYISS
jgi:hypothetical protein